MTESMAPEQRLAFIDNLRWSAISMVVVMHAAVTYSPFGRWYWREPSHLSLEARVAFAAYQSLQHAVSMGLLFGIAGYFAAGALARHGAAGFLRERLRRLGLPLLLYVVVIGPLTEHYVAQSWRSSPQRGFLADWWWHAANGRLLNGSGPLWFCLVLLVFSALLVLRARGRPLPPRPGAVPGRTAVLAYAAAMAALAFAAGLAWPRGKVVLNIDLHDFPQYPLMFAAGVAARRGDWLRRLSPRAGRCWLWGGLAASMAGWAALVGLGGALRGDLAAYGGGWHWQAAGMDGWRAFTCLALSLGLVALFREHWNGQGTLARFLTRNAFGVYVLHAPVLVAVTRALHGWPAPAGVKFVLASIAGVTLSFLLVGFVARRIPGLRSVI